MAEIHIQKKKRPVWPWILIIAAVLIAAWLLIENTRVEEEIAGGISDIRNNDERDTVNTSQASIMVNDYIRFINDEQPSVNAEGENFINEGIRKLSNAISAVAAEKFQRNSEINSKADLIQKKSDNIITSESSNDIKEVADNTVDVFNSINQNYESNIETDLAEVKNSVEKIASNKPAKNQQNEIINFLKESGDVLQRIAADDDMTNRRY